MSINNLEEQAIIMMKSLNNINYEILAVRKKIAFIEATKDSIWHEGYEEAIDDAMVELNKAQDMYNHLLEYIDRYNSSSIDIDFLSSKELEVYGIKFSFVKGEEQQYSFKSEKELELEYEKDKCIIESYRQRGRYSGSEIIYLESLLFFAYGIFLNYSHNKDKIMEARNREQKNEEKLKKKKRKEELQ